MAQNIYDDSTFFGGYAQLPRSVAGLSNAPEWPILKSQLPDMRGLRVLDLGCGYGWFSRWAAAQGAKSVLGLDVSEKMLARAREKTVEADGGEAGRIEYKRQDLETLELPKESFDLAYSSLAFHYIHDFERLLNAIHAALVSGAKLVFSIEHPIFLAPRVPGWVTNAQGERVWGVGSYMMEGGRIRNWLGRAVEKQHRTLGTVLMALIETGFVIRFVRDFGPDEELVEQGKVEREERERPMFLLVAVEKVN